MYRLHIVPYSESWRVNVDTLAFARFSALQTRLSRLVWLEGPVVGSAPRSKGRLGAPAYAPSSREGTFSEITGNKGLLGIPEPHS